MIRESYKTLHRSENYHTARQQSWHIFGAKILHPTCVLPVEKTRIPLRLKHTMNPGAPGTLISTESSLQPITAVAAKDGITAIKIYSHRMLQTYGFLKKVFQVFEQYHTSVDLITTSEVAVSLTIDDTEYIAEIENELSQFSEVQIDHGYSIICIVGNGLHENSEHVHRIFNSLKGINLRMISLGGSRNNISLLVSTMDKIRTLQALHHLFEHRESLIKEEIIA